MQFGTDRDNDTIRPILRTLSQEDRALLETAHDSLEHPSLAARLSAVIGTPLEIGIRLLPRHWYARLQTMAERSILHALDVALSSVRRGSQEGRQDVFHKVIGGFSGAAGGFFGLPGLLLELPVTTTIMMRAIADIARHEGENLAAPETRLACVQVFALGGRTEQDDAAETGYYGVRLALALSMSGTLHNLSLGGLQGDLSPAMARFVSAVAARFGVPMSQKAASQLVPYVGAACGAAVNVIFLQHFEKMAHGHFTIRRLERKYGPETIKRAYAGMSEVRSTP